MGAAPASPRAARSHPSLMPGRQPSHSAPLPRRPPPRPVSRASAQLLTSGKRGAESFMGSPLMMVMPPFTITPLVDHPRPPPGSGSDLRRLSGGAGLTRGQVAAPQLRQVVAEGPRRADPPLTPRDLRATSLFFPERSGNMTPAH